MNLKRIQNDNFIEGAKAINKWAPLIRGMVNMNIKNWGARDGLPKLSHFLCKTNISLHNHTILTRKND